MTSEAYLKRLTEGTLTERLEFLAKEYQFSAGGASCQQVQASNRAKADLLREAIETINGSVARHKRELREFVNNDERGDDSVAPLTDAEMDEFMKDITNFLFPEGEQ